MGDMSVEYQNSILWRGEDPLKKKFKPARDTTTATTRYFPGKAPKWVREEEEKEKERQQAREEAEARDKDKHKRRRGSATAVILEEGGGKNDSSSANKGPPANSRLARLQNAQANAGDAQERLSRHRRVHEVAQILEEEREEGATDAFVIAGKRWVKDGGDNWKLKEKDEDKKDKAEDVGLKKEEDEDEGEGKLLLGDVKDELEEDSDDEELKALRRDKARELALLKRKQEEDQLQAQQLDEEEEDDEDDSGEESDSDDDPRRMLKPVFVRKAQRDTV